MKPAPYCKFANWTGSRFATNNLLTIVLDATLVLQANFIEILTTNHPTPVWWLAAHGYTQDLETVVMDVRKNGIPI